MRLADQRMYANKSEGRRSFVLQTRDILLQAFYREKSAR
jgi:hypothetical protein